jgi:antitoxin component of MazEF toxin-antitoxin module
MAGKAPTRFTAVVDATGRNTTGIRVPDEVLDALDAGRRPKVVATLGDGYTLRTTVGSHSGSPYLSVSAAVRKEAGLAAGDEVTVVLALDDAPREVEVPDDLAAALAEQSAARQFFEGLTDSQRKTFVLSVTSAKKPETRERRVAGAVTALVEGRKRP